jgi:hypothetical protein
VAGTKKFVEGVSPPVFPLSTSNLHLETVKRGKKAKWEKRAERAEKKKAEKKKEKNLTQTKGQKRDLSPPSSGEDDDWDGKVVRGGSPVKLTKKNHLALK